jgi:hypothetical protein
MKHLLTLSFVCFFTSVFSQKTSEIIVDYAYTGNKDQSIKEVEEQAIIHAKIKALSQAGIKEHVKTYSSLFRKTDNDEYNKIFTSAFFSEKQGAVTSYEIIEKSHSYSSEDLPICYVKINAVVIRYEKDADYNYNAVISGLKPVYSYDSFAVINEKNPYDGCAVRFNVTPSKDTYLTIFALWENKVHLLFPASESTISATAGNGSIIFNKNVTHGFGDQPVFWFDSDAKSTSYRLIFVLHKDERKFREAINIDNMWKWIFEIPRDLRYVTIEDFIVFNLK